MSEKMNVQRKNNAEARQEEFFSNKITLSDSNKAWVCGIIEGDFEFSHKVMLENFYRSKIRVARASGVEDYVPIVVPELLLNNFLNCSAKDKYVELAGQFRSFNKYGEDGASHLDLFLFVTDVNIFESKEEFEEVKGTNLIYLEGYLCKAPTYRTTPFGREITDLHIAVNRRYNKSDYIPCITWGKVARYASQLEVGDKIRVHGRVQSREYFKRYSPESAEGEYREAYEISISRMLKIEEEQSEE